MDHFSLWAFSRPMAFILETPQSTAFLSCGEPVTRAPMLSLKSVRYSKAREPIRPSPAILVRAGLVPSSSGPLDLTESFACNGKQTKAIAKTKDRKRELIL